jgi:serine/threonine protein kinase
MVEWKAKSTKIQAGESVTSSNYSYKIKKELNDGKMAVAYYAKRSDGFDIFLKQTKDPNEYSPEKYKYYVNAQHNILNILNKIGTEYVEHNYEFFEFKGRHFQAKEFINNGKTLKSLIWPKNPNKKINFETRLRVIEKLAFLIDKIHRHDLIHSDLKPEQIMVGNIEANIVDLKLIDFDHSIVPSLDIYLPAGTPTWYSPEHNRENIKVGAYSDIFTLGSMFYTIITGGLKPFHEYFESDSKYRSAITITKSVKPLNKLMPGFPDTLSDLIQSMLHPNYTKRPSAKEVYDTLISFREDLEKPKYIKIYKGSKSRIITDSVKFTRAMAKSSFGEYQEIFTNQFEVIKDSSGDWFIKGLPVPNEAKTKTGETLHFYPTKVEGKDITNRITPIEDNMKISIGDIQLTIKTKHN